MCILPCLSAVPSTAPALPPPARFLTHRLNGELRPNRRTPEEVRGESAPVFRAARQRIQESRRPRTGDSDLPRTSRAAAWPHERAHRVWAGAVRGAAVRRGQERIRDCPDARPGEPDRATASWGHLADGGRWRRRARVVQACPRGRPTQRGDPGPACPHRSNRCADSSRRNIVCAHTGARQRRHTAESIDSERVDRTHRRDRSGEAPAVEAPGSGRLASRACGIPVDYPDRGDPPRAAAVAGGGYEGAGRERARGAAGAGLAGAGYLDGRRRNGLVQPRGTRDDFVGRRHRRSAGLGAHHIRAADVRAGHASR